MGIHDGFMSKDVVDGMRLRNDQKRHPSYVVPLLVPFTRGKGEEVEKGDLMGEGCANQLLERI